MTVNGEVVQPDWVHEEFSQIKSWFERTTHASCCERDNEFMDSARDNVIRRMLIAQEADRVIPELSENEIDLAIRQLKKEMGGEAQFFAHYGIAPAQEHLVRPSVAQSIRVDKLVRRICGDPDEIDESALQAFYQEHISHWMTEESIRCLHIYKAFKSDRNREELFRDFVKVRKRILGGADFMEEAGKFTDKPVEEIDLGWFKRGEIMEEFEIIAFSLETGEVSPVFSTHHGFHMTMVAERNPSEPIPLEKVRDEVVREYKEDRREKKLREFVDGLRATAVIEGSMDE
jgi:parvulin-like peptidyl-prolyl isomerase